MAGLRAPKSTLWPVLAGFVICGILAVLAVRLLPPAAEQLGTAARPTDPERMANQILRAVAEVDPDAFTAVGGGEFKRTSLDTFGRLVEQHSGRLRNGYRLQRIDSTVRREVEMTRWKVVFTDGTREATLTLGMSGGTVRLFSLW